MNQEVRDFIFTHRNAKLPDIALKLSKSRNLPTEYILNQINGLQKANKKFPFLSHYPNFVFGSKKNVSQSSSELTALFKSKISKGERAIDLSGGMGIDSYFLSQSFKKLDYVEMDEETFQNTQRNFEYLKATNINCHHTDAETFLKSSTTNYDLAFIDPDRKIDNKKTITIEDSQPNILEIVDDLLKRSKHCLIKLSPLIDLQEIRLKLKIGLKYSIHVLAVNNDCKEVLIHIGSEDELIHCHNHQGNQWESYSFDLENERKIDIALDEPLNYLYEPNVSILKAGAFKSIAFDFKLKKIASNTHLYTSEELVKNFPGRTIKILETKTPSKRKNEKWNLVSRNFGIDTNEIKKKYKIKDGGSQFLYAFRNSKNKPLFVEGIKL